MGALTPARLGFRMVNRDVGLLTVVVSVNNNSAIERDARKISHSQFA